MRRAFDMMRYQHCNDTLLPYIKRNKFRVFFWIFSFFALFTMLGAYPATRSEARWFEIVREMLLSGDWLHPTINGYAYFDKPLVSYWLAAVLAKLAGGHVTEFICRVPSALFALLAIKCSMYIAEFVSQSKRTGLLAGWLMLGAYSTLTWGRLAEADMEQTGFILAATVTYLKYREKPTFPGYLLFWTLCAIGAQTKGLPALVIPPMLVVIDVLIRKEYKKHVNLRFFGALLCGATIYMIPFILVLLTAKAHDVNGLVLVFRENIVRVFNPWDHNKYSPFCYFEFVPRLLIPWTLFFLLAFFDVLIKWIKHKNLEQKQIWLFLSMIAIFVLFSVSRSRRSYYILPIVPFCLSFTAVWLTMREEVRTGWRKASDGFMQFFEYLIPPACLLLLMMPFTFKPMFDANLKESGAQEMISSITVYDNFAIKIAIMSLIGFILSIVLFVWWLICRRKLKQGNGYAYFTEARHSENRTIVFYTVGCSFIFSIIIPTFLSSELFSPEIAALKSIGATIEHNAEKDPTYYDRIAFFGSEHDAEIIYYLGLRKPVKYYEQNALNDENRGFLNDSFTAYGLDDFRQKLKEINEKGGMVISHAGRFFDRTGKPLLTQDVRSMFALNPGEYADNVISVDFNPFDESSLYKNKIKNDETSRKAYLKEESKRLLIYSVSKPVSGEPDQPQEL